MEFITALIQTQLQIPFKQENIPTKTVDDLQEKDFVRFSVENEIIVARLFGVFKTVPTKPFILEECLLRSDIPPSNIYQVQKDEYGKFFLQGIKKGFDYKT